MNTVAIAAPAAQNVLAIYYDPIGKNFIKQNATEPKPIQPCNFLFLAENEAEFSTYHKLLAREMKKYNILAKHMTQDIIEDVVENHLIKKSVNS